jgi:hypothetical protein
MLAPATGTEAGAFAIFFSVGTHDAGLSSIVTLKTPDTGHGTDW